MIGEHRITSALIRVELLLEAMVAGLGWTRLADGVSACQSGIILEIELPF